MKNIDFLPSRYRERTQMRRLMIWRAAALVLLALIIFVAHGSQLAMRRSAAKQLAALESPYQAALATSARLQQLQTKLAASNDFAALYTYLQHPWPTTQLLVAISQTLPPKLTLTEIQFHYQAGTKAVSPSEPTPAAASNVPAPLKDLLALRAEMDNGRLTVKVTGLTTDVSALQEYVSGFQRSPFFQSAKLESLESLKDITESPASRFEVHLDVRPGYGQPNGPTGDPAVQNRREPVAFQRSVGGMPTQLSGLTAINQRVGHAPHDGINSKSNLTLQ